MSIDSTSPRTRRAILAGGIAAAAAASLARVQPVSAHDADDVRLGGDNTATSPTTITNTTMHDDAFASTASGIGTAVRGYGGTAGIGVYGSGDGNYGVLGSSASSTGVYGSSSIGRAVFGTNYATNLAAVVGQNLGGNAGVHGYSGLGVPPASPAKTGVFGMANQDSKSVGVRGTSPAGRGGVFKGGAAQVKLLPSAAATHPASGQRGDLFVDNSGRLWFCKGSTTWKQLA
jgi:hypothetical protein